MTDQMTSLHDIRDNKEDLLIFLHIPKTAGTSFYKSVASQLKNDETLLLYGFKRTSAMISEEIQSMDASSRNRIRFIAGHQVWYGIHNLFPERRPRYVTFLRDPVSRVVSEYWKIMRTPQHALHSLFMETKPSVTDFLSGKITPLTTNHMTVFLGRSKVSEWHNIEQCARNDPTLLGQAFMNLRKFWYVGLKESFLSDLHRLGRLLKVECDELHHNKPEEIPDARKCISLQEIEMCAMNNQMDCLLYHSATLMHDTQEPQSFVLDLSSDRGTRLESERISKDKNLAVN